MADILTLVAGLVVLIVGADMLVRGAAWFARAAGLSKLLVGLTLVAFGTSAPELVVCVLSALEGSPGLATGTVLGSNAANIGLIVGSAALVQPILKLPGGAMFELRFALAAAVAPFVPLLLGGRLDRWYAALLVAVVVWFTIALITRERRRRAALPKDLVREDAIALTPKGVAVHSVFFVVGLAGLVFGGQWLVSGASAIARDLGVSDQLIGVLLVAVGTSLPELATSVLAARSGHPEIAIGNVLGSNIFNVFLVLGTTALIEPLPISWPGEGAISVLGLLFAIALAVMLSRVRIGRRAGIGLLTCYVLFLVLFPPAVPT
jgi:cation:H+ antiporter